MQNVNFTKQVSFKAIHSYKRVSVTASSFLFSLFRIELCNMVDKDGEFCWEKVSRSATRQRSVVNGFIGLVRVWRSHRGRQKSRDNLRPRSKVEPS